MNSRILLILLFQYLLLAGCSAVRSPFLSDAGMPIPLETGALRKKDKVKPPGPGQYQVLGKTYSIMPSSFGYLEIGIASWYGEKFHGRLTAMGEVYDMYAMTAAHKSLPLPTMVRVTNLDNGQSIVLRVNDRGPFHDDRLIDLSYGAAKALGFHNQGTASVVVEAMDEANYPELTKGGATATSYLQAGAFSRREGAVAQLTSVREALPTDVQVRILMSETSRGVLYKVWIGPLATRDEENLIVERIEDRNLGKPVKVKIGRE